MQRTWFRQVHVGLRLVISRRLHFSKKFGGLSPVDRTVEEHRISFVAATFRTKLETLGAFGTAKIALRQAGQYPDDIDTR